MSGNGSCTYLTLRNSLFQAVLSKTTHHLLITRVAYELPETDIALRLHAEQSSGLQDRIGIIGSVKWELLRVVFGNVPSHSICSNCLLHTSML